MVALTIAETITEMDTNLRQQPVANERADRNQPLVRFCQPAGNKTDHQYNLDSLGVLRARQGVACCALGKHP